MNDNMFTSKTNTIPEGQSLHVISTHFRVILSSVLPPSETSKRWMKCDLWTSLVAWLMTFWSSLWNYNELILLYKFPRCEQYCIESKAFRIVFYISFLVLVYSFCRKCSNWILLSQQSATGLKLKRGSLYKCL